MRQTLPFTSTRAGPAWLGWARFFLAIYEDFHF